MVCIIILFIILVNIENTSPQHQKNLLTPVFLFIGLSCLRIH